MEAKKTNAADVYKKAGLYRSIGLVISLLLVNTAFMWKTYDRERVDLTAKSTNTFELLVEIPPTEQPPPPPPVQVTARVVEVPDEEVLEQEIKVNIDMEVTEEMKVEQFAIRATELEVEETDRIFTVVEETASPKGGLQAFYQYVALNVRYPATARRLGIQGRVFVEFVIAKDGTLTDVRVVKGIGAGCDEEALRIVQAAPPWNPAKQRGKPVRQRYTIPITFKMANM